MGAGGRDARRPGGARRVRRRAAVVRPGRPRRRHPRHPQPVARPGRAALGGDGPAVRPLGPAGAARHPAADERHPGRDPRGGRRRARGRGRCTSRSGGCGCGPPYRRSGSSRWAWTARPPPPACSTPSARPTWSCCRRATPSSPSASSSACPACAMRCAAAAAPVVGVSPLIGGVPVRGHADACLAAIGVESTSLGRRRALRRLPGRMAGGRRRRRRWPRARATAGGGPAALDAPTCRRPRDIAGAALDLALEPAHRRRMTRSPAPVVLTPLLGMPRGARPATTWPRWSWTPCPRTGWRCATATCWSSPARWSPRRWA